MKKILFIFVFLLQLVNSFGQSTTTQGTELFQEITYFKTGNGYKAPKGFEWMKPTKLYFKFYCMALHNDCTPSNDFFNHRVCKGRDLADVNSYWKDSFVAVSGGSGNYSFAGYADLTSKSSANRFGRDPLVICLDCGLGYYAAVTLVDDYITNDKNPNQGFGYTCGQPTAEAALKLAWEAARSRINKSAVHFSYTVGVNAAFDKSESNSETQTCYNNVSNSEQIKPYAIPPDNSGDFVRYIISQPDYNTWGSNIIGITDKTYPIFTTKIGADKPGNIAQHTQNSKISTTNKLEIDKPGILANMPDAAVPTNAVVNVYKPSAKKLNSKNVREQPAEFDGDWAGFLQRNFVYPDMARENNIQGKVRVSFIVTKDGLSDIKAISGPKELYSAAEELIRKSSNMWIPARQNSRFVTYQFTQTISYVLSDD